MPAPSSSSAARQASERVELVGAEMLDAVLRAAIVVPGRPEEVNVGAVRVRAHEERQDIVAPAHLFQERFDRQRGRGAQRGPARVVAHHRRVSEIAFGAQRAQDLHRILGRVARQVRGDALPIVERVLEVAQALDLRRIDAVEQRDVGVRDELAQVEALAALGDRPRAEPPGFAAGGETDVESGEIVPELVGDETVLVLGRTEVANERIDEREPGERRIPRDIVLLARGRDPRREKTRPRVLVRRPVQLEKTQRRLEHGVGGVDVPDSMRACAVRTAEKTLPTGHPCASSRAPISGESFATAAQSPRWRAISHASSSTIHGSGASVRDEGELALRGGEVVDRRRFGAERASRA